MTWLDPDNAQHLIDTCAGLGAGAISTIILYPFDLIKTQYQVHESSIHPYRTLRQGFDSILQRHGIKGLFQGMSPAIYGSTVAWGLYMFLYNNAKARYASMAENDSIRPSWQYFFSAMEAGILCIPVTNPLFLIKIRMQVQTARKTDAIPYKSFSNAFHRIIKEEGVLALYKGVIPALFLTSHGAFKFLSYELMKRQYMHFVQSEMEIIPTLCMGSIAQVTASTITYPYQVMKARLQQGGSQALRYHGTWDCAQQIAR